MGKLVWFVAIAMIWAGGQGVYQAVTNRASQTMSCEQANTTPPTASWLHLTGCRVSMMEAAYTTRTGGELTGNIYLPLASANDGESKIVRFVVATSDPAVVSLLRELAAVEPQNQAAFLAFIRKNANRLNYDKDVQGMVQSGINKNDKIQARLRELNKNLAADFVVIEEGKEPALVWPAFLVVAGVSLFLYLSVRVAGKKA